jgi:Multidrug resistance efflux pump
MSQQQAPIVPEETAAPAAPNISAAQKAKQRKRRMRTVRSGVIALVVVAVIIALAYALQQRMKGEEKAAGDIMDAYVQYGSITSMVEGGGYIKARDSVAITPSAGGTVREVFVMEGDQVYEGQLLFTIDDSSAADAVAAAQKKVDDISKELQNLRNAYNDLIIRAPHAGKLMDTGKFTVGEDAGIGAPVATLVDDTRLKLSLYYSYAYEGQISVGQAAQISVPATMGSFEGKVTEVNYVRRIATEGSVLFHVVFEFNNPGTLTEGMDASAALTAGDGSPIYAYESGALAYRQTTVIAVKAAGPILSVNLLDYMDVSAGQVLLSLGTEDNDLRVIAKEKELADAHTALADAQKGLENLNAVAPMSGTVMSCSLLPDTKVEAGMNVTISDTTVMIVNANVEDRSISFVSVGMPVDIDQWGMRYTGFVESISLEGTYENGTSVFPIVIRVENSMGELRPGMGINYYFVASQSDNCLVIPIQCVQYSSDPETGERISMVFLKADERPDNAVDIEDGTLPEGYYAIPIRTGISDVFNVEVLEGLELEQVIYQTTMQENYW